MHWRRAGLAFVPGLLALGCSQPSGTQVEAEAAETTLGKTLPPHDVGLPKADTRHSEPVPKRLLGTWVYSHEECEPGSQMAPDKRDARASINFYADRNYGMKVEGFDVEGTYRYQGGDYPRITLDNLLNFNVEGETLQNWSEGDAVYLCGRVFVREK